VRATSVVVDASIALKWYLVDEPDRAAALAIFEAWEESRLDFVVPGFWPLEVVNGIRKAMTRKERNLAPERAREHVAAFLAMGIATVDVTRDLARIYDEAARLGTTVYDMSYVDVAGRCGIEFVTSDERLVTAVGPEKPFVKHLRDYKIPSLGMRPEADICQCGHSAAEHYGVYDQGELVPETGGACKVPGCDCQRFRWSHHAKRGPEA
jgi:predicted nucleic acid-binding protein